MNQATRPGVLARLGRFTRGDSPRERARQLLNAGISLTVGVALAIGVLTLARNPAGVFPQHAPAAIGVQFAHTQAALDGDLSPQMVRVLDWITSTYAVSAKVAEDSLVPALAAAEETAQELGFDPLLLVAIMAVESSFNPRAVSQFGAQGLMQVIPRYHQDKIGPNGGKHALFDPETNVRVGSLVLHEGMRRHGTLQRALQAYNGALHDASARYAQKVLAMKKRLRGIAGQAGAGSAA